MHSQTRTFVSQERRLRRRPPRLRLRPRGRLQEVDGPPALALARDAAPSGVALLVAAARRRRQRTRRGAEGRHAAARARSATSTSSIRRSPTSDFVADRVRDLREAVQPPGRAGRGGNTAGPGGRRVVHGLPGRADVHVRAEADVPLPHGRGGDGAELRGRVRPRRQPAARSPATRYMHEIVGADAVIDGKARTISGVRVLGRYRLQIRLTRPLGDFTARLTMPFFCPVLPGTPVDPAGIDNPPGSGPYYVAERIVEPADRAEAEPVLPRRPAGECRPGRLDDRREPRGVPARDRAGPDRLLRHSGVPPAAVSAARREVRHQPAGRPVLRRPGLATCVSSPSTTTGRRSREPGRSRSRRRSTTRSTGRSSRAPSATSAGKRTDQLLPPALGARREHLPARGSRPGDRAQVAGTRRRRSSRRSSCSTRDNGPLGDRARAGAQLQPEADRDRPRGQVLRPRRRWPRRLGTRGEPFDIVLAAGPPTMPTRPASSCRCSAPTAAGNLNFSYFDDPVSRARIEAANRLTRRRHAARPGPTSTST